MHCKPCWNVLILWPWSTASSAWERVLYTDPSHILVFMLEWSDIMSNHNTQDIAVRIGDQSRWWNFHLCVFIQLINVGEEVLVFYNDRNSFQTLLELMRSERDRFDPASPLMYHINLVQLLSLCTEGKNVYTEIKCHSLLPLDDIVKVVTNSDCIPEVQCYNNTMGDFKFRSDLSFKS